VQVDLLERVVLRDWTEVSARRVLTVRPALLDRLEYRVLQDRLGSQDFQDFQVHQERPERLAHPVVPVNLELQDHKDLLARQDLLALKVEREQLDLQDQVVQQDLMETMVHRDHQDLPEQPDQPEWLEVRDLSDQPDQLVGQELRAVLDLLVRRAYKDLKDQPELLVLPEDLVNLEQSVQ